MDYIYQIPFNCFQTLNGNQVNRNKIKFQLSVLPDQERPVRLVILFTLHKQFFNFCFQTRQNSEGYASAETRNITKSFQFELSFSKLDHLEAK